MTASALEVLAPFFTTMSIKHSLIWACTLQEKDLEWALNVYDYKKSH